MWRFVDEASMILTDVYTGTEKVEKVASELSSALAVDMSDEEVVDGFKETGATADERKRLGDKLDRLQKAAHILQSNLSANAGRVGARADIACPFSAWARSSELPLKLPSSQAFLCKNKPAPPEDQLAKGDEAPRPRTN